MILKKEKQVKKKKRWTRGENISILERNARGIFFSSSQVMEFERMNEDEEEEKAKREKTAFSLVNYVARVIFLRYRRVGKELREEG